LLQGDDPAYFRAAKFCDIVFVDRELPSMTSHLAFAKGNSALRDRFNEAINEELIFLRRIYERYQGLREMIRNQECEELLAKHRRYQPLCEKFFCTLKLFSKENFWIISKFFGVRVGLHPGVRGTIFGDGELRGGKLRGRGRGFSKLRGRGRGQKSPGTGRRRSATLG
jgi:hypothetical protein